jgi:hypothetical protein
MWRRAADLARLGSWAASAGAFFGLGIADTSVYGVSCSFMNVWLYDNHGTADGALDSQTLQTNGTATLTRSLRLISERSELPRPAVQEGQPP